MNITRLVEKIFIRSFLIVTLFSLQSCSNTLIGEKLESSFDIMEKPKISEKTNIKTQQPNEKTTIKSIPKDDKKENNSRKYQKNNKEQNSKKPRLLSSCFAFRPNSEVVKRLWPEWYKE